MIIQVLFFAQLREAMGKDRAEIEVANGATINQVVLQLMGKGPLSSFKKMPLAFSVNETFVHRHQVLENGDTLALLPPVSGG